MQSKKRKRKRRSCCVPRLCVRQVRASPNYRSTGLSMAFRAGQSPSIFQGWTVRHQFMRLGVKSSGKAKRAWNRLLEAPRSRRSWRMWLASAINTLSSWSVRRSSQQSNFELLWVTFLCFIRAISWSHRKGMTLTWADYAWPKKSPGAEEWRGGF